MPSREAGTNEKYKNILVNRIQVQLHGITSPKSVSQFKDYWPVVWMSYDSEVEVQASIEISVLACLTREYLLRGRLGTFKRLRVAGTGITSLWGGQWRNLKTENRPMIWVEEREKGYSFFYSSPKGDDNLIPITFEQN